MSLPMDCKVKMMAPVTDDIIKRATNDVFIKIDGNNFMCEKCSCSIFKRSPWMDMVFTCNGCGTNYRGH